MEQTSNTEQHPKRPELLTMLCILTFIGSGLAAFANLTFFLSYDEIQYMFDDLSKEFPEIALILNGGKKFFIAGFILYTISLMGALQMWKLRKIGFHLYTAAQVFILILPVVTIESFEISIFGILITVAFILSYFSQLKLMS